MNVVKIINMIRGDTNRRTASEQKQRVASCLIVVVVVVLSMICGQSTPAQKILWETGFENYPLKIRKDTFNTATDTVKTGKKSLAIFSENQDEVCVFGKKLNTDKPVISVEFWVYIESGGQSFGVSVISTEKWIENQTGGPYIDWGADSIRCHINGEDSWREISQYVVNEWSYVRIVADFEESLFDFYMGENREEVLDTQRKKDLPFQEDALAPHAKGFVFFADAMKARGYIDNFLIYEGEEPHTFADRFAPKLSTLWGRLKQE